MSETNVYKMQGQALEVAGLYDKLNVAEGRKPWTVSDYMAGYVGDVGDLSKLVMAREGKRDIADVDAKIKHELDDNLWSLLVLYEKLGYDPGTFDESMTALKARVEGGQA